ncbi:hypothetical protein SAMN02799624_05219 [Paenibacillus sp. UNC496MF]|uniref:hypothetical protein n=1 Tax=Paenibacillus sp. UNC496MF TaxID=1502753 RepID=UPI0008E52A6F|nr:hypothetical protein [Paenibacillus sp. UNC496MF]SFJ62315.1 hypothetical protein SAMN02799624_05219 [Paenibacillus sp. UNC496MF]
MPEIKVGLTNQMGSFYDPKTNMYITPSNPVQVLNFDANTDLSGIVHAILGSAPALNLYEGDLPQAAVDAWKAKYDLAGKMAKTRADQIAGATRGPVMEVDTSGHGQVKANPADAITAQSEGEAELVLDLSAGNEPAADAMDPSATQEPAAAKRGSRNK